MTKQQEVEKYQELSIRLAEALERMLEIEKRTDTTVLDKNEKIGEWRRKYTELEEQYRRLWQQKSFFYWIYLTSLKIRSKLIMVTNQLVRSYKMISGTTFFSRLRIKRNGNRE